MPRAADAQPECIHHIFIFLKHRPECARKPHPAFFCLPELGLTQLLQFSTGETKVDIAMRKPVL
jgi:hypothetical protein